MKMTLFSHGPQKVHGYIHPVFPLIKLFTLMGLSKYLVLPKEECTEFEFFVPSDSFDKKLLQDMNSAWLLGHLQGTKSNAQVNKDLAHQFPAPFQRYSAPHRTDSQGGGSLEHMLFYTKINGIFA